MTSGIPKALLAFDCRLVAGNSAAVDILEPRPHPTVLVRSIVPDIASPVAEMRASKLRQSLEGMGSFRIERTRSAPRISQRVCDPADKSL